MCKCEVRKLEIYISGRFSKQIGDRRTLLERKDKIRATGAWGREEKREETVWERVLK